MLEPFSLTLLDLLRCYESLILRLEPHNLLMEAKSLVGVKLSCIFKDFRDLVPLLVLQVIFQLSFYLLELIDLSLDIVIPFVWAVTADGSVSTLDM